MTLVYCVRLGLAILIVVIYGSAENTEMSCNPKSCNRDQNTAKPVCGSDGLTYPSRCLLERSRCVVNSLSMTKRGPCRHQPPCKAWKMDPMSRFRPNCRPDGSYAAAQCYADTGYCWCVTPQGLPLSNTASRRSDGRPLCGRKTRRRDASRRSTRPCRRTDKAKFNNNLINIFHSEWERETGTSAMAHNNDTDLLVNRWKFRSLDADGDDVLDKTEYRELKRMVKKAVKPKKCAKNFPGLCDVNGDGRIGMQEWAECLTRDGMDDGSSTTPLIPFEELDDQDEYPDSLPHRPLPNSLIGSQPTGTIYDPEDSPEVRDEEPTGCVSDREAALGTDGEQVYVPECTPDGKYKKVQCYKSANYCFCVDEDTGKNIPGTSVKNGVPECNQMASSSVPRPMKGCPEDKKSQFLRDLLRFLHTRMTNAVNVTLISQWKMTGDESAAKWTFVILDKNKNEQLDRNEWKAFKEMVGGVKSLKKCGKKLPRYCDSNKDRRISMTEWLVCLNVQQDITNPPKSPRAGQQNPIDVLIED